MNQIIRTWIKWGAFMGCLTLHSLAASAGTSTVFDGYDLYSVTASTQDLYFTTNVIDEFHSAEGAVWQISKQGSPGAEKLLYSEEQGRHTQLYFSSVTYAEVAGTGYVYFVANYEKGITYIKRVPAAGGPAATITRTPFIGIRDLKTDGTSLYFADKEGIRSVPVAGGALTTLVRSGTGSQIGLDANFVYFNSGTNGATLYRVPKAGGSAAVLATASSPVTDIDVYAGAARTTLYWAEENAAVRSYTVGDAAPITYQAGVSGRTVTSVGFDGIRVLWTDCKFPGESSCSVKENTGGSTFTIFDEHNGEYNVGAGNVIVDQAQVFWSNLARIFRYVHSSPPSAAIVPASISAVREGRGSITRSATALVTAGEAPFTYSWSIDVTAFPFQLRNESGPTTSIFAALAACDSADTTLSLTVTDAIGRRSTSSAPISFKATRPPRGSCD